MARAVRRDRNTHVRRAGDGRAAGAAEAYRGCAEWQGRRRRALERAGASPSAILRHRSIWRVTWELKEVALEMSVNDGGRDAAHRVQDSSAQLKRAIHERERICSRLAVPPECRRGDSLSVANSNGFTLIEVVLALSYLRAHGSDPLWRIFARPHGGGKVG